MCFFYYCVIFLNKIEFFLIILINTINELKEQETSLSLSLLADNDGLAHYSIIAVLARLVRVRHWGLRKKLTQRKVDTAGDARQ